MSFCSQLSELVAGVLASEDRALAQITPDITLAPEIPVVMQLSRLSDQTDEGAIDGATLFYRC